MRNIKSKETNLIKIGLIGMGRWGKNIARDLLQLPGVELSCVASKNPDTGRLIKNNCKIFSEWKDLINYSQIDAVIICTPPKTHFEIAKSSIIAGYATLIEKPITLDYDEAKSIYELSISSNKLVMIDFTQLFNYKFIAMKEYLKIVGKIKLILTRAGNFGPYHKDSPVLWDWGVHDLSILITLLGSSPNKIFSKKISADTTIDGDASTWEISCDFDNKIKSRTLIGNMMPKCREVKVFGSNGVLVLDDLSTTPLKFYSDINNLDFPNNKGIEIKFKPKRKPLYSILESFSDLVIKGENKHWSMPMAVEISRLLSKC